MEKFFQAIKRLRPAVQAGKTSRDDALRILMQESGVSEDVAARAADNMIAAKPEVSGGISSLKPDVTFTSTQKKLPDPIDMSVEERTGGMLKEGKEGEYTSTMNRDKNNLTDDDPMGDLEKIVKNEGNVGLPNDQASGAANVDPSIMTLGDEDAFKYEMAQYRQRRERKMQPIYKKYGAVTERDRSLVDEYVSLDSEDNIILSSSNPKYDKATASIFIQESAEEAAGQAGADIAANVLYGRVAENILVDEGLDAYIDYAFNELKKEGLSFNKNLLKRVLKEKYGAKDIPDGFANGGRIGFSEGVGRKGILSALANKLNEIAPGSTAVGKTTKAMNEAAARKRAEEELFKGMNERLSKLDKPEPNVKIIDREEIDVDIGTIEDFYDDFVRAGGDPSVTLKDLKQGYNLKKAYPFNTPYIDRKGKLIGQEATQKMYPESKKFYIEDPDVLSQRITDIREGKMPKTAEGERTGLDVTPVPKGFKLSKEKLMNNFPEIDEDFANEIMAMDKDLQGRMIEMLENRRLDPKLYDELLEKFGDTEKFQGEYDKALRRRKNASGGLNYLMGF